MAVPLQTLSFPRFTNCAAVEEKTINDVFPRAFRELMMRASVSHNHVTLNRFRSINCILFRQVAIFT